VDGWTADAHYSVNSQSWGHAPGSNPLLNRLRYATTGPLVYSLPLPAAGGAYRLTLLFAEQFVDTPGERRMHVSVTADGRPSVVVDPALDVLRRAGAPNRLMSLSYPAPDAPPLRADALVRVSLVGLSGGGSTSGTHAFLSGLRLDPAPGPWRAAINCGGPALGGATSGDGAVYAADGGYSAGSRPWAGRLDEGLSPVLRTARFAPDELRGGLVYTVPVPAAGLYRLRLTWVELEHPGAGRRRMDVYVGADEPAVAAAAAVAATATTTVGGGDPNSLVLPRVAVDVDVFGRAGHGMDRAVSSEFVVAASTSVTVQLVGTVGSPMLTTLVVTTEPTPVATEAGAGTELGVVMRAGRGARDARPPRVGERQKLDGV